MRAYVVELAPHRDGYPDRRSDIRRRCRIALSTVLLLLFILLLPLLLCFWCRCLPLLVRLGSCAPPPQRSMDIQLSGISG